MSFTSWLRALKARLDRSHTRRQRAPARRFVAPLRLESLEERTVPSTVTWINPNGGDWDTGSNWSGGSAPDTTDDAIINDLSSGVVITRASGAAITVNNLSLSSGTLGGSENITVTGLFEWTGGTLSGPAGSSLTAEGSMTLGGGTLDTRDLVNDGAASLTNGLLVQGAPAITNSAGATFDLQPSPLSYIGSWSTSLPGDFYNAGTVTSEAPGHTNAIGLALHNSGTVEVHAGELNLLGSDAAGPTSSGAITGDPGTLIVFGSDAVTGDFTPTSSIRGDRVWFGPDVVGQGGNFVVQGAYSANGTTTYDGASLTFAAGAPAPQVGSLTLNFIGGIGGGTVTFSGATPQVGSVAVNVRGTVDFSPTDGPTTVTLPSLTLDLGNLTGSDSFVVTGAFTWSNGGALSGPAGSSLTAEGGMTISGSFPGGEFDLDTRNLINDGAAVLTGGFLIVQGGPNITNSAGATFDLPSPGFGWGIRGLSGAFPAGNFYNAGTLTSEAVGSYHGIGLAMHNSGTIAVHSGELDLTNITSSGAITGDPGTLLAFVSDTTADDFTPSSPIAADQVVFVGGAYLVEGSYSANATETENGASVTFPASAPAPRVGDLAIDVAGGGGTVAFDGPTPQVGAVTINNHGTVDFSPASGPATLTLLSLTLNSGTLSGSDEFVVTGAFAWNDGGVSGPAGSSLTAQGGMTITNGTLDTRDLVNDGAAVLTSLLIVTGGPDVTNSAGATFDIRSDLTGFAQAGFTYPGYGPTAGPGDFYNAGALTSEAARLNAIGLALHNTGTVTVNAGELDLLGNVLNAGTIDASNATSLEFDRQVTLTPNSAVDAASLSFVGGSLDIQLGGANPGTGFPQIQVSSTVSLGVPLQLDLVNGFTPSLNEMFTIISNQGPNQVSGIFADLGEGATLSVSGYQFQISYHGGTYHQDVTLTVTQVPQVMPTISVADAGGPYNGGTYPATATVAGVDGVPGTSLEGVGLTLDYQQLDAQGNVIQNLGATAPINAGTYQVTASFAGSTDYAAASTTSPPFTISQVTPSFTLSGVTVITDGTPSVKLTGTLSYGSLIPTGSVTVTLDGVSQTAAIDPNTGAFSATFATGSLPVGTHTVGFSYAGDGNFTAASAAGSLDDTYGIIALFNQGRAKHPGSTLPIQLELAAGGQDVSSSGVAVTALGIASTTDTTDAVGAIDPSHVGSLTPAQSAGDSNPDDVFRYQGGANPFYMFNLQIPSGLTAGTYRLYFSVEGDPLDHWVTFTVD